MIVFKSGHGNLNVVCKAAEITLINRRQIMDPGFSAQFTNGVFRTANPDEIKMLRAHPRFNMDYHEEAVAAPTPSAPAKPKPKKKTRKR